MIMTMLTGCSQGLQDDMGFGTTYKIDVIVKRCLITCVPSGLSTDRHQCSAGLRENNDCLFPRVSVQLLWQVVYIPIRELFMYGL